MRRILGLSAFLILAFIPSVAHAADPNDHSCYNTPSHIKYCTTTTVPTTTTASTATTVLPTTTISRVTSTTLPLTPSTGVPDETTTTVRQEILSDSQEHMPKKELPRTGNSTVGLAALGSLLAGIGFGLRRVSTHTG